jgi:hypothetical protein
MMARAARIGMMASLADPLSGDVCGLAEDALVVIGVGGGMLGDGDGGVLD